MPSSSSPTSLKTCTSRTVNSSAACEHHPGGLRHKKKMVEYGRVLPCKALLQRAVHGALTLPQDCMFSCAGASRVRWPQSPALTACTPRNLQAADTAIVGTFQSLLGRSALKSPNSNLQAGNMQATQALTVQY